jgi:hypothetical protein
MHELPGKGGGASSRVVYGTRSKTGVPRLRCRHPSSGAIRPDRYAFSVESNIEYTLIRICSVTDCCDRVRSLRVGNGPCPSRFIKAASCISQIDLTSLCSEIIFRLQQFLPTASRRSPDELSSLELVPLRTLWLRPSISNDQRKHASNFHLVCFLSYALMSSLS